EPTLWMRSRALRGPREPLAPETIERRRAGTSPMWRPHDSRCAVRRIRDRMYLVELDRDHGRGPDVSNGFDADLRQFWRRLPGRQLPVVSFRQAGAVLDHEGAGRGEPSGDHPRRRDQHGDATGWLARHRGAPAARRMADLRSALRRAPAAANV